MPVWFPALMIAMIGSVALTVTAFAPGPRSRMVAALVPLWPSGGLARLRDSGVRVPDARVVTRGGERGP